MRQCSRRSITGWVTADELGVRTKDSETSLNDSFRGAPHGSPSPRVSPYLPPLFPNPNPLLSAVERGTYKLY